MDLYRSKDWKVFRDHALRLDGNACVRCLRGLHEVILHVHHKYYIPGRKPWEYPYEACEVLCRGCHAQEHGIIQPTSDWVLIGYDDLGDVNSYCDYCRTPIRHVFIIDHAKWSTLEVGETCCDKLIQMNDATVFMSERRRYLERQKRFAAASEWESDQAGVIWTRKKGIQIKVIPLDNSSFNLRMNGKLGKLKFKSQLEAKMKAFAVIDSGEAARYFEKVGR